MNNRVLTVSKLGFYFFFIFFFFKVKLFPLNIDLSLVLYHFHLFMLNMVWISQLNWVEIWQNYLMVWEARVQLQGCRTHVRHARTHHAPSMQLHARPRRILFFLDFRCGPNQSYKDPIWFLNPKGKMILTQRD